MIYTVWVFPIIAYAAALYFAWGILVSPYPKWLRLTVAVTTIAFTAMLALLIVLTTPPHGLLWLLPIALGSAVGHISFRIWKRYTRYQSTYQSYRAHIL